MKGLGLRFEMGVTIIVESLLEGKGILAGLRADSKSLVREFWNRHRSIAGRDGFLDYRRAR